MKKIITLVVMAAMAATAYAFVPLSNSQEMLSSGIGTQAQLGSFQRGATRGMFYNELDIISAAPTELLDFSGNVLYTQWGNMRNWNDIATQAAGGKGQALDWDTTTDVNDTSFFNIGVTGNPFSYINIEDSRSGIVFQNYGALTDGYNLDNNAGNEGQGSWRTDTAPAAGSVNRTITTVSDATYEQAENATQLNAGTSYKLNGLISLGLSMSKVGTTKTLTTAGEKTYIYSFNNAGGAIIMARPATATYMDSLSIKYPDQEIDNESEYSTDILPQARINIADSFHVDAAIGIRKWTRNGVNDIVGANNNQITAVTVTASEDVLVPTENNALSPIPQYFNSGMAIVGKTAVAAVQLDYDAVGNITNAAAGLTTNVFKDDADDSGITAFEDDRSGIGPLIRLEAVKKFEKVDITGIYNYSRVEQDIDAKRTNREYIRNSCVISTWSTGGTNPFGIPVNDNFVETDSIQNLAYSGQASRGNLDVGGKIAFKAMEGVKLSIGGFISRQVVKENYTTTDISYELSSYDDGYSSTDAWDWTGASIGGGVVSSGTVGGTTAGGVFTIDTTRKPGAIPGSAQADSRTDADLGNGMNTGRGEGTWEESKLQENDVSDETITMTYSVPVGVEIPLSKKWTFRAGTEYQLTKTKRTVTSETGVQTDVVTITPSGEAAFSKDLTTYSRGPVRESIDKTESHSVFYTYGVQFDPTPSLTIACNAFLDTAYDPTGGAAAEARSNASIFDLATYRLLSLSAAFKF